MSETLTPAPEETPDQTRLQWFFEAGEEREPCPGSGEAVVYPYRTIFAVDPTWIDDRCPLADLDDEASDEVGRLMAQAPVLLRVVQLLRAHIEASIKWKAPTREEADLLFQAGAVIRDAIGPWCASCGKSFSEQEARAGYTTCEHCPAPDGAEEGGAS